MSNRFYDLRFSRLADGSIRLIQPDGGGEDCIIDLHREQIAFIARHLCGMNPEAASNVADLERRISVLVDKLQDIVCDMYFRGELLDRCGDALGFLAKLDAVLDLALEFDGGRLKPEYADVSAEDEKPIYPCAAITEAKQKQRGPQQGAAKAPGATVTTATGSDGQMGLPV